MDDIFGVRGTRDMEVLLSPLIYNNIRHIEHELLVKNRSSEDISEIGVDM